MAVRWLAACAAFLVVVVGGIGLAACGSDEGDGGQARGVSIGPGADFMGITSAEVFEAKAGRAARRQTFTDQHAAGARIVRQALRWYEFEPVRGRYDLPRFDAFVADAARARLRVLPILFGTPTFYAAPPRPGIAVTETTELVPASMRQFARYVDVIVRRYGRGGSFWQQNPSLPVMAMTSVQIWNEPNLPQYWGGAPNAREYVAMLRAGSRAARAVDPGVEVLAGGLPQSKQGIPLEDFVAQMYDAGARGTFDTLALHPYARTVSDALAGVRRARAVAVRRGDADVETWITEIGWAAGRKGEVPGSAFTVSRVRQALRVRTLYREAAAQADALRLRGVVYYAWRDVPAPPGGRDFWGLHTGLVNRDNTAKFSLSAYAAAGRAFGK